jgi:hypothetical protein
VKIFDGGALDETVGDGDGDDDGDGDCDGLLPKKI